MMPSTITSSTPVRPFHPPGASGSTPLAKRPAPLVPATGASGPVMNATDLNDFVYGLHYKIESIGVWAANLHEPITDLAGHIDDVGQRAAASFGIVKAETDSL